MSLFDRAVGLVERGVAAAERIAPGWGLSREVARSKAGMIKAQGYSSHGASRTKKSLAGWVTQQGGPDADITANLRTLQDRSRDLFMGEPLAAGALRTIRTNEVGAGLRLNAQIDARFLGLTDDEALAWEEHTERLWALWAETTACDSARKCTFGELQSLARLSQLMSGDVFALLPAVERPGELFDLRIKLLEADRVINPYPYPVGKNVFGGVEVDADGVTQAYYIARLHPGDVLSPGRYGVGAFGDPYNYGYGGDLSYGDGGAVSFISTGALINRWDRVPAYGPTGRPLVLHLMDHERPGQRRGVPVLAPVIERFKMLSRYSDAEIMAAVVSGYFTAAITSEGPTIAPGSLLPPGQQVTQAPGDNAVQLGNGSVVELSPGAKIESVNPARPNAQFSPFVDAILRQIAAGLPGMTYGLLVKQFDTSYTAARAEILEAWKSFRVGRRGVALHFCQPIYEQWLEEAIARRYIDAPGFFSDPVTRAAWCGSEWCGPAQGALNPVQEAEAAEKLCESGFMTRTQTTAEMSGGNWERNHRVRVREERLRREGQVATNPSVSVSNDPPAVEEPTTKKKKAAA